MSNNHPRTGRAAVVLAAGSGSRLAASTNKVWLPLGGHELATWSFKWLHESALFDRYVLVVNPAERELAQAVMAKHFDFDIKFVDGGKSRHESEYLALQNLAPVIKKGDCSLVLIHDGARPLAMPELIRSLVEVAERDGGALPYLETAQLTNSGITEDVVRVQTPQVFQSVPLLDSYERAADERFEGTDTAMCLEKFHPEVSITAIRGSAQNLKVTYPQDLVMAEHIISAHAESH